MQIQRCVQKANVGSNKNSNGMPTLCTIHSPTHIRLYLVSRPSTVCIIHSQTHIRLYLVSMPSTVCIIHSQTHIRLYLVSRSYTVCIIHSPTHIRLYLVSRSSTVNIILLKHRSYEMSYLQKQLSSRTICPIYTLVHK